VFSGDGLQKLHGYDWPGNIRELQNVVERSVILRSRSEISAGDILLPANGKVMTNGEFQLPAEGISLEAVEQSLIEQALSLAKGNRSQAARLLQIPRHVLIYRLEKFNIDQ
jgi:two-component system, NtrC family, response regulator